MKDQGEGSGYLVFMASFAPSLLDDFSFFGPQSPYLWNEKVGS